MKPPAALLTQLFLVVVATCIAMMATANATKDYQSVVPALSAEGRCFSKGETNSCMKRICECDCLGDAADETIKSTDLCPRNIKR